MRRISYYALVYKNKLLCTEPTDKLEKKGRMIEKLIVE